MPSPQSKKTSLKSKPTAQKGKQRARLISMGLDRSLSNGGGSSRTRRPAARRFGARGKSTHRYHAPRRGHKMGAHHSRGKRRPRRRRAPNNFRGNIAYKRSFAAAPRFGLPTSYNLRQLKRILPTTPNLVISKLTRFKRLRTAPAIATRAAAALPRYRQRLIRSFLPRGRRYRHSTRTYRLRSAAQYRPLRQLLTASSRLRARQAVSSASTATSPL